MLESEKSVEKGEKFKKFCEDHAALWFPDKYFRIDVERPPGSTDKRMDLHVQTRVPGNKALVIECKHYPSEKSRLGGKQIDQILGYGKDTRASWKMMWISDVSNPSPSFRKKAAEEGITILPIDTTPIQREASRGILRRISDLINSRPPEKILADPWTSSDVLSSVTTSNPEYLEAMLPTASEMYEYVAKKIADKDHGGDVKEAWNAVIESVPFLTNHEGDTARRPRRHAMLESDLIKPKTLEVEDKTLTPTYGRFIGEPFERGFGTTLGNALRRILLSSLSGAAITKVRIDNVLHEFSTLPGVTEDVTDILLNLKEIRFRLDDSVEETVTLKVKGAKSVSAGDLVVGPQVEILNPEAHIAKLSKDGKLEMEAEIRTGRGYVAAERDKSEEEDPVDTIPLDAVFSPVRKVNVTVTNARVGQRTDYERLALEVWTDGSTGPREAVAAAAQIAQEQLSIFSGPAEEIDGQEEYLGQEDLPSTNENLFRPIKELALSVRSANCLQSADIRYVGELVVKAEPELLKTKNFGRKSLNEIKELLHEMGLELGMHLEDFPPREELDRRRISQEDNQP